MLAKGKKKSWQKYVQEIYCPQNWVRPQRMATAGTFLVKILQLTLAQISTLSGRGQKICLALTVIGFILLKVEELRVLKLAPDGEQKQK